MGILRAKTLDLKRTRPLTEKRAANTLMNQQEALEGKYELQSYPQRLVFELTSACNIRCKMCGRNAADFKPTVFQMEWLNKFPREITDSVEEATLLGWGEPTLHPQFPELLGWAHERGLRIFFCTNGTKLGELQEDLFKNEVDLLTISLDGADAQTNNRIRCGADFDLVTGNVKRIVEERKKRKVSYPYMSFVMTMMRSNFQQFPDYIRLAKEIGIEEVKGVNLTVFDEKMEDESIYNLGKEMKEMYREAERIGEELGISVKLPYIQGEDPAGDKRHKDCYVGWRDFFLGSDGYVRSCMSTSQKLFQIEKYQTFQEIWNAKEYQSFRSIVNSSNMPIPCTNCYQASYANWNQKYAFIQMGNQFAPEWEE